MTLTEAVETHRDELVGLAYRLLGSVADAEDAVQEAFLRLERHGTDGIDNVGGWLSRTTSRVCLDRLRAARTRREVYAGPWLPEPFPERPSDTEVAQRPASMRDDPSEPVELAESMTMAFLVVLESLSPAERVAFVLHDVFAYGYDELASVLDRSEQACRQLVARARSHVRSRRPRFDADAARRDEVVARFLDACASGDTSAFLEVLAPSVVLRSDGGGKVAATRRPVEGVDHVSRFMLGLVRQAPDGAAIEPGRFNASPGFVVRLGDGRVDSVWVLRVVGDRIVGIDAVRNPDKLTHLA